MARTSAGKQKAEQRSGLGRWRHCSHSRARRACVTRSDVRDGGDSGVRSWWVPMRGRLWRSICLRSKATLYFLLRGCSSQRLLGAGPDVRSRSARGEETEPIHRYHRFLGVGGGPPGSRTRVVLMVVGGDSCTGEHTGFHTTVGRSAPRGRSACRDGGVGRLRCRHAIHGTFGRDGFLWSHADDRGISGQLWRNALAWRRRRRWGGASRAVVGGRKAPA